MKRKLQVEFGKYPKYFEYDFVNTTQKYNKIVFNLYAYKGRGMFKKEINEMLMNTNKLRDINACLKKLGYYLYLFRSYSTGINCFYIVVDTLKNKMLYDENATLLYIEGINIIDNAK